MSWGNLNRSEYCCNSSLTATWLLQGQRTSYIALAFLCSLATILVLLSNSKLIWHCFPFLVCCLALLVLDTDITISLVASLTSSPRAHAWSFIGLIPSPPMLPYHPDAIVCSLICTFVWLDRSTDILFTKSTPTVPAFTLLWTVTAGFVKEAFNNRNVLLDYSKSL